jgi:hypothetical protein
MTRDKKSKVAQDTTQREHVQINTYQWSSQKNPNSAKTCLQQ